MKFFHLSDLHIGLKLFNYDLSEDQAFAFQQIIDYAHDEHPDAIVIAGDIYDKAIPSAEAVELFDSFVSRLNRAVPNAEIMMIAGNHDSAPRVNVFRSILSRQHVHMIGLPPMQADEHIEKVTLTDAFGPVNFYLLPFVKPSMIKAITSTEDETASLSYNEALHRLAAREQIDEGQRNVLVSHQFYLPASQDPSSVERMESEVFTIGNIDCINTDILSRFDYAALGHIHKPMRVGSEFARYCGTPMPYSLSEANQAKGIIEVTMNEKGNVETTVLPLHPLHAIRKIEGTLDEVLAQASDDYAAITLKDDSNTRETQDRINYAFPRCLTLTWDNARTNNVVFSGSDPSILSPYDFCLQFLNDLSDDEKHILQDAVNAVQEGDDQR